MNALGIKELQINPSNLTKAFAKREYTLITKHSKPIGIAVSFDDEILSKGLKTALLIEAYKDSSISLGQFSKALSLTKKKAMNILSLMGISIVDYDFDDDLKSLNDFL